MQQLDNKLPPTEITFTSNCADKKEKEETDSSSCENSFPSNIEDKNETNIKKIFNVVYRQKTSLFTSIENVLSVKEESFIKRKRNPERRRRRDNQDNMRKKIKRAFINKFLIQNMNELLKNSGSKLYFEKIPPNFVGDITKNLNNKILNMTLEEIFENVELYGQKDFNNYNHNLNVLKSKDIQECQELKEVLNKKYCELFEEYINSKEFNIDEINRLKSKNMKDSYIKRYIYLAQNFIQFITEQNKMCKIDDK
jgi:hypothetical protein